jgi:hypothetical protein
MPTETELAVALQAELRLLVTKYQQHDHLTAFTSTLEEVVEEIEACIEDTEDVE